MPSTADELGLHIKAGLVSVDKVAGKITEFLVMPGSAVMSFLVSSSVHVDNSGAAGA